MTPGKMFLGKGRENIPDIGFHMMSLFFRFYYFFNPQNKYVNSFGIRPGSVVVDYGCGPGGYLKWVSEAVGQRGKVYALDIHKLAIKSVMRLIERKKLKNVIPVLAQGYSSEIEENTADLIYAVDMFHMIEDVQSFLDELYRIIKMDGVLILEHGHQPRETSRKKVDSSGKWVITNENERYMRCLPLN